MITHAFYKQLKETFPHTFDIGNGADVTSKVLTEYVHPSKIMVFAWLAEQYDGTQMGDFIRMFKDVALWIPNILDTFNVHPATQSEISQRHIHERLLSTETPTIATEIFRALKIQITDAETSVFPWAPLADHITMYELTNHVIGATAYTNEYNTATITALVAEIRTPNALAFTKTVEAKVGKQIFAKIPLNIILCALHADGIIGEYNITKALTVPQTPLYAALYIMAIGCIRESSHTITDIITRASTADISAITGCPTITRNPNESTFEISELITTLNSAWNRIN